MNYVMDFRLEEESLKIYNKLIEMVEDQNNAIKFIDYVNTIVSDRNKYTEEERNQIIKSVLLKIFVTYSNQIMGR